MNVCKNNIFTQADILYNSRNFMDKSSIKIARQKRLTCDDKVSVTRKYLPKKMQECHNQKNLGRVSHDNTKFKI
jgi:hypothetical protein